MGLFEIYLAGVLLFGGYGAGYCYGEGGNHAVGPEVCAVATTVAAVVWPVTVPAAIIERSKVNK